MEKLLINAFYTVLLMLCLSCNKDIIETNATYQALQPLALDANAGNWKPFIVGAAADLTLPAPADVSSAIYLAELKDLKSISTNPTAEQRTIIDYWKAGSVLRWNEIMRELVAKHNLAPYQSADGTYPVPNAANPFDYPQFPFSSPPYAARAYAYVSAAQYDALILAWKYKSEFSRPAPYITDGTLTVSIPKSNLPSYPSEDAVIAGVSFELLKLLFPADIEFITRMANEDKSYRLWSGANVQSDIAAGDSLGRWVARKVIQRARTDGMATANGNPSIWKQLETDCRARGETPWLSQESPVRPPMLCQYGNLKALLFQPDQMASLRAVPPPASNGKVMREQLDEVLYYSQNQTRERMRIVNLWADGSGTYTPPGHWNAIASEEFVRGQYSEVRWARNLALLNAAMMDAGIVCWNTKYFYFNARPSQLDPRIKTLTGLPNFPAYISGHSSFSGAAASVLGFLLPAKAEEFKEMALEASNSRLYGGIHYRADCEQGLATGEKVAKLAIERAKADGAD